MNIFKKIVRKIKNLIKKIIKKIIKIIKIIKILYKKFKKNNTVVFLNALISYQYSKQNVEKNIQQLIPKTDYVIFFDIYKS